MNILGSEKYAEALRLRASGSTVTEISSILQINRKTVNRWTLHGSLTHENILNGSFINSQCRVEENTDPIQYLNMISTSTNLNETLSMYSFILGLYLGDGNIHYNGKTKTLTIAVDKKYEDMNNYIITIFTKLFGKPPKIFDRSIDRGQKFKANSLSIKHSSINLGLIFPHEGKGRKHNREIILQPWQESILNPVEFIRGLIYSDGCYSYHARDGYYMYNFTNYSKDILKIFIKYCNKICILEHFILSENAIRVNIYSTDVTKLYSLIGCKTDIVNKLA